MFYFPFYPFIYLLTYYFSSEITYLYPLSLQVIYVRPASRTSRRCASDWCDQKPKAIFKFSKRHCNSRPTIKPVGWSNSRQPTDGPIFTIIWGVGLEFSYYWPKLPFIISPKFVLPVSQVKGPRPEKKLNKRKNKSVVITSFPYRVS